MYYCCINKHILGDLTMLHILLKDTRIHWPIDNLHSSAKHLDAPCVSLLIGGERYVNLHYLNIIPHSDITF